MVKRLFMPLVVALIAIPSTSCSPHPATVQTSGTIWWMRWEPVVGERCPYREPPLPSSVRFYDPQGRLLAESRTRAWRAQDPGSACVVATSFSIQVPKASVYTLGVGRWEGGSVRYSDLAKADFIMNAVIQVRQIHAAAGKAQTW